MEIKDALPLARELVEEAGLPEKWQERAFGEVLRNLLGGGHPSAAEQPRRRHDEETGSRPVSALGRLATRLGVSESALGDVFAIEDDRVTLHVASVKLPTTKSKATREIALLIAAARQGAGIDESWTDVSHIRDALAQYNRYDQSNFAKHLREIDDVFNLRGKPVQQLRLTRPGWEAATDLARGLAGSAK